MVTQVNNIQREWFDGRTKTKKYRYILQKILLNTLKFKNIYIYKKG